ncbi:putative orfan [Tupanvirus soda lake]|uniref:Orfan n=2 Tax=Tupanvirus TaxID=2094720 RepID=A0AC62ADE6_9VIRU|nr:putative orfan [Tupanvirus soda lake]QKU35761.1 putative orfan [Tupanvirus soda lake]
MKEYVLKFQVIESKNIFTISVHAEKMNQDVIDNILSYIRTFNDDKFRYLGLYVR